MMSLRRALYSSENSRIVVSFHRSLGNASRNEFNFCCAIVCYSRLLICINQARLGGSWRIHTVVSDFLYVQA